jgi:hypothetical protein
MSFFGARQPLPGEEERDRDPRVRRGGRGAEEVGNYKYLKTLYPNIHKEQKDIAVRRCLGVSEQECDTTQPLVELSADVKVHRVCLCKGILPVSSGMTSSHRAFMRRSTLSFGWER